MSYDLYLLGRDEIGDDPAGFYERLEEREEREPNAAEEEQLRRLGADLQAANPGLDLAEAGSGFLLQLGYQTERPVVIDIGGDEITMSWSYGADDPRLAIEEVRKYLPVFERHGYVAYDPQLERLFDVERDSADAIEIHRQIHQQLDERYGIDARKRRPWWRRLFG